MREWRKKQGYLILEVLCRVHRAESTINFFYSSLLSGLCYGPDLPTGCKYVVEMCCVHVHTYWMYAYQADFMISGVIWADRGILLCQRVSEPLEGQLDLFGKTETQMLPTCQGFLIHS